MIVINEKFRGEDLPEATPKFRIGQLVRHKRYQYRGVVVALDRHCKADPDWYMSNKTQPDRAQAWYHVLVHGSTTCTYAAESGLMEEADNLLIEHPLVAVFFDGFEEGHYLRNDKPWPA